MRRQRYDGMAWSLAIVVSMIAITGCNRPTGSIDPPEGWTEESFVTSGRPITIYQSPDEDSLEPFREQISFITEETATFAALEAFVTANKRQATIDAVGLEIVEETDATVAGLPARRLVYTHHLTGIPLKTASYFIVDGGTGFCISCTTTAERFETREPELRAYCETLKIQR